MGNLFAFIKKWYFGLLLDVFMKNAVTNEGVDTIYVLRNAHSIIKRLTMPSVSECIDSKYEWHTASLSNLCWQLTNLCDELEDGVCLPVGQIKDKNRYEAARWLYSTHNKPDNVFELPQQTHKELHSALLRVTKALDNPKLPVTLQRLKKPLASDVLTTINLLRN